MIKNIVKFMFNPFGIFSLVFSGYKSVFNLLIEKSSDNKKDGILGKIDDFYKSSNDLYQDTEIYNKYFEVSLTNTINDIKSNLENKVIIPIHKLYHKTSYNPHQDKSSLHKFVNMSVEHSMNKSFTSDLILLKDRLVIKSNIIHPLGKLRKQNHGIDELEIFYRDISSIQFKSGDNVLPGTMTFVFPGKPNFIAESSGYNVDKKGTDPYILYFFEELNNLMRDVKELMYEKRG